MTTRYDTYPNILLAVLLCALSLQLFCACSDEDISAGDVSRKEILFGFGNGEKASLWEMEVDSRAATDEPADLPKSVGVFGYIAEKSSSSFGDLFSTSNPEQFYNVNDDACPKEMKSWPSTHDNNLWPYADVKLWANDNNYKFVAYAPYDANPTVSPSATENTPESITMPTVPVFSDDDYLYSDIVSVSYSDANSTLEGKNKNILPVAMHHLMSRIRFCFKIGSRYKDLRKIKLTKLEVKNSAGKTAEVKIDFATDGTASASVISTASNTDEYLELDYRNNPAEEPDGFVLSSADNPVAYRYYASLYVLPSVVSSLGNVEIRVNYEVYDLAGKLLRKDVVTNKISLGILGVNLNAGKYRNVNISIEPKYLYVLSDIDIDFDGFIVISGGS